MFLISHRGNFDGPTPEFENRPDYLMKGLALTNNFHMEIDVWKKGGQLYLGHDSPDYKVNVDFLANSRFWCHAKNLEAFEYLLSSTTVHCFWHQNDDFALTSQGYIWTYPDKELTKKSICVMPELQSVQPQLDTISGSIAGICSDFIREYYNG